MYPLWQHHTECFTKNPLCSTYSSFLPSSFAPGKHWSFYCFHSFAFLEWPIVGIIKYTAFSHQLLSPIHLSFRVFFTSSHYDLHSAKAQLLWSKRTYGPRWTSIALSTDLTCGPYGDLMLEVCMIAITYSRYCQNQSELLFLGGIWSIQENPLLV